MKVRMLRHTTLAFDQSSRSIQFRNQSANALPSSSSFSITQPFAEELSIASTAHSERG